MTMRITQYFNVYSMFEHNNSHIVVDDSIQTYRHCTRKYRGQFQAQITDTTMTYKKIIQEKNSVKLKGRNLIQGKRRNCLSGYSDDYADDCVVVRLCA